ncbi:hypothetical protein NEOLEDRAFT_1175001 [Neolentinus lepideus HHB14362 ss-1]|uniref:DUF4050 domain-containing protein n=1 Tax=Neolentinus lepideus HHB14362 ss-1 TaxID=1314782 RepID=A0A165V7R0_9AGAM|nr:hypothetical protein NEOLEDRAFT_1175001 [Neolentinus lepideus HHB14362 ss-1]
MSTSDSEERRHHAKRLRPGPHGAVDVPSRSTSHQSPSHFSRLLENNPLPPPGPDHFAARRALWLTPPPKSPPHSQSADQNSFDNVLSQDPSDKGFWKIHLERAYDMLMAGRALKHSMSMKFIVRVVYAGWIHNGLWPKGVSVDDTDSFLGDDAPIYTPPNLPPEPGGPP